MIARQLTAVLGPIAESLKTITSRLDKLESYEDPFANLPPGESDPLQMDYLSDPLDQDQLYTLHDQAEDAAWAYNSEHLITVHTEQKMSSLQPSHAHADLRAAHWHRTVYGIWPYIYGCITV